MEGNTVDSILILGTSGMLLLAIAIVGFVLLYQRRLMNKQTELKELELNSQREMMEAVILAKEKEQKRIAQELHDGIGSALTAMKISLIQMQLETEDKRQLNKSIKSISTDVRRISNELMPSILEDMGLRSGLEYLIGNLKQSTNIKFFFEPSSIQINFPESVQLAIYRVSQEILNNITKYAEANSVEVKEVISDDKFNLTIKDNGKSFIPADKDFQKKGSLGLKNIQSRIQQVNGVINYTSLDPGTCVTIEIPIDHVN